MKRNTPKHEASSPSPAPPSPTHQVVILHGRCIVVEEGKRVTGLDQEVVLRECED